MRPKVRRLVVIAGASNVLGVAGFGGAAGSRRSETTAAATGRSGASSPAPPSGSASSYRTAPQARGSASSSINQRGTAA